MGFYPKSRLKVAFPCGTVLVVLSPERLNNLAPSRVAGMLGGDSSVYYEFSTCIIVTFSII